VAKNKLALIIAVIFLVLFILLPAIAKKFGFLGNDNNSSDSDNKTPVVIVGAIPPSALDLAARVIVDKAWDKEAGFRLELRPIFPEASVPAITGGTVDIIGMSPLSAVRLVNDQKPVKFIANGLKVDCPFFVNKESSTKSWQDLRGKKLGTTSETGPSFTTFQVVMKAKEGVDVDEYFKISHSSFAELIPRLLKGEIDGAYGRCTEVGIAQATEDAGFKIIGNIKDILFRDGEFQELMTDGVVAPSAWVNANYDLAIKFQDTLYRAYGYIKEHPEIYDDPEIRKAYALEEAKAEVLNKIKELVPGFYTFVDWEQLVEDQYKFFELAQKEGLLDKLPSQEELFLLPR